MIKNSKYKNTGFLYDILVRQITDDLLNEGTGKSYTIIKKYFGNMNEITKELGLYKMLIDENFKSETRAINFIDSVIKSRKRLDNKKLNNNKYNLIKEIKKNYNIDNIFKTRINNYKLYSSIFKLFEYDDADDPVDINKAKNYVLSHLLGETKKEDTIKEKVSEYFKNVDSTQSQLIYEIIVNKFNSKYKNLIPEQKEILHKYITSSTNSEQYINFLKDKADNFLNELKNINIQDKSIKIKVDQMNLLLKENYDNIDIVKDKHVLMLMKFSELIKELKK
jgi:hypothetical protein